MLNYNKRLTEVDEILNYFSEEDLLKIPEQVKKMIKEKKDKNYIWKYDESKSLLEQNLNRDTVIFLSYLNMEYLLNEEEKELMVEIHKLNQRKIDEANIKKYKANEIFGKPKLIEETQKEKEENTELVEYKENIFIRIFRGIKNIFSKKC